MDLFERPTVDAASHDPIEAARAWLNTFDRIALATVIETWGSSPVPVGGQLAVAPDGRFEGSVSGGCVEAEVIHEAENVIAGGPPKVLTFGVADETAWRAGLPCGGRIEILLEALGGDRDRVHLDAVLSARRDREPLVVRTRLADGFREIFDARATRDDDVATALRSGISRVIDEADGRAFLRALMPVVHLVIVGATHIGQVFADLAGRIGWRVSVVDPRSAFATEERFGGTARRADWPEPSFRDLRLDARAAVVALTHVAHIDDEALGAALRSPCFYVGALGSTWTHAKRVERLKAAGFADDAITRIHAPVGLAIGAKGPEEIAVSILADIVKTHRGA